MRALQDLRSVAAECDRKLYAGAEKVKRYIAGAGGATIRAAHSDACDSSSGITGLPGSVESSPGLSVSFSSLRCCLRSALASRFSWRARSFWRLANVGRDRGDKWLPPYVRTWCKCYQSACSASASLILCPKSMLVIAGALVFRTVTSAGGKGAGGLGARLPFRDVATNSGLPTRKPTN